MQTSAVKWLINQIGQHLEMPIEEGKMIIEKAEKMFEEQIIDAYDQDLYGGLSKDRIFNDGKDYYNETYGSKGSDETKTN